MVSEHRDSSTAKIVIFSIYERRILKHADPSIPDTVEDWLDDFNTFSIYQVLPELIDLWGMNVQTQAESKKKYVPSTGK